MKMFGLSAATSVAALSLCVGLAGAAGAQAAPAQPGIGVAPADAKPDDPNGGQWFVFNLEPGDSGQSRAHLVNPATVPQTARLYFRDMVFNDEGTPVLRDGVAQQEVGTWAHFEQRSITIQPQSSVDVPFSVTVPENAEPGDHLGALVVEGQPAGTGLVKTVTRVATRLYVTVPGVATKSFRIESIEKSLDSFWFPQSIASKVTLRNTGRIRLKPTVKVAGVKASGPALLLSRSVEPYAAAVKVPWWGGPVSLPVRVVTAEGLVREAKASMFVIPWGLLASLAGLAVVGTVLRKVMRRRVAKVRGLKSDLARLEQLLVSQGVSERGGSPAGPVVSRHEGIKRPSRPADDDANWALVDDGYPREDAASARRERARVKAGGPS